MFAILSSLLWSLGLVMRVLMDLLRTFLMEVAWISKKKKNSRLQATHSRQHSIMLTKQHRSLIQWRPLSRNLMTSSTNTKRQGEHLRQQRCWARRFYSEESGQSSSTSLTRFSTSCSQSSCPWYRLAERRMRSRIRTLWMMYFQWMSTKRCQSWH